MAGEHTSYELDAASALLFNSQVSQQETYVNETTGSQNENTIPFEKELFIEEVRILNLSVRRLFLLT